MKIKKMSSFKNRLGALTAIVALTVFTWSTNASASYVGTPFAGERPMLLDVHAGLSWHGWGLATGARFGIPIVDNGFVKKINNAVYINFGADFYWVDEGNDYGPALGFPVTLHWQFYFHERWSAWGEAGVNIYLPNSVFDGNGWSANPGAWIMASVGGAFHINKALALVLNIGNPYSAFGIQFKF